MYSFIILCYNSYTFILGKFDLKIATKENKAFENSQFQIPLFPQIKLKLSLFNDHHNNKFESSYI